MVLNLKNVNYSSHSPSKIDDYVDSESINVQVVSDASIKLDWGKWELSSAAVMITSIPPLDDVITLRNQKSTIISNLKPNTEYVFCVHDDLGWGDHKVCSVALKTSQINQETEQVMLEEVNNKPKLEVGGTLKFEPAVMTLEIGEALVSPTVTIVCINDEYNESIPTQSSTISSFQSLTLKNSADETNCGGHDWTSFKSLTELPEGIVLDAKTGAISGKSLLCYVFVCI